MLLSIIAALTLAAQAETPLYNIDEFPEPEFDAAATLAAPPRSAGQDIELRARRFACGCKKTAPADAILDGLVIDAELTLGADQRSASDRQATIFNVYAARKDGERLAVTGRTRVFHSANEKKCGVTFDYGKRYQAPVRKTETGDFETDFCLLDAMTSPGDPITTEPPESSPKESSPKSE